MDRLCSAAKRAIVQSLKVKKGEKLLLVTDRQKMKIAEALAFWAKKSNAEVTTYLMTETVRPIDAPTEIFKEMIADSPAAFAQPDLDFTGQFLIADDHAHNKLCDKEPSRAQADHLCGTKF